MGGGLAAWIDIESGKITSMFCDLKDNKVLMHPLSGKIIIGMISDVRYTSWDIAVIRDDKVAIVEGNTYGNFNIQQVITQQGVYQQYKDLY